MNLIHNFLNKEDQEINTYIKNYPENYKFLKEIYKITKGVDSNFELRYIMRFTEAIGLSNYKKEVDVEYLKQVINLFLESLGFTKIIKDYIVIVNIDIVEKVLKMEKKGKGFTYRIYIVFNKPKKDFLNYLNLYENKYHSGHYMNDLETQMAVMLSSFMEGYYHYKNINIEDYKGLTFDKIIQKLNYPADYDSYGCDLSFVTKENEKYTKDDYFDSRTLYNGKKVDCVWMGSSKIKDIIYDLPSSVKKIEVSKTKGIDYPEFIIIQEIVNIEGYGKYNLLIEEVKKIYNF